VNEPSKQGRQRPNRASADGESADTRKKGFLRSALGVTMNPLSAFPRDQIIQNGRLIGDLVRRLRAGGVRDDRLYFRDDRRIDMEATAFAHGMTVVGLEALLSNRQRQAARAAYLAFGLGWLFFLLLLFRMLTTPLTTSHLVPLLEFLPFCAAFFLMAFRSALQNFQLRERRLATAAEYLTTPRGFWPTRPRSR
jgi:hypothetical protein